MQTYRRARHSVSLLHTHLVSVTNYQRKVFNDAMLSYAEHITGSVCAELDIDLNEFNGEADHVHLPVAYPPTAAVSALAQHPKSRAAHAVRRESTGARVRARIRDHLWSPSHFAVSCRGAPLSINKQYIDGQTRPL
ncbi:IS200/IS605 family transposase [Mycobacterium talmoniae]|uniref:IS200/IS605 family transposase n=1 Tax=Mycobacterium talmoniae TaxID=1858794 RepID=A0A1S1NK42_9MYCO|nr:MULTISPECIES: IS200/IS605 family transposase [Mycobacterium]OHV04205.1 IS200/IS605 family transposase [Mycobacterium talmoniae]PQM44864.1 hypothetical protein C1Y40_04976 [Mycobacterium talmoniae]TDH52497.1 IS200/IS605 family transposase [Mycobacterium eburneum]